MVKHRNPYPSSLFTMPSLFSLVITISRVLRGAHVFSSLDGGEPTVRRSDRSVVAVERCKTGVRGE